MVVGPVELWARGSRVWARWGQPAGSGLSPACPHVPQGAGRSAGLVHKSTGQIQIYIHPASSCAHGVTLKEKLRPYIRHLVAWSLPTRACPDGIRVPSRPHHVLSLSKAGWCLKQVFGEAGLAFQAITVMITRRNAWWDTRVEAIDDRGLMMRGVAGGWAQALLTAPRVAS